MTADDTESKHVAVKTIADGGREWEEGQEEKEREEIRLELERGCCQS